MILLFLCRDSITTQKLKISFINNSRRRVVNCYLHVVTDYKRAQLCHSSLSSCSMCLQQVISILLLVSGMPNCSKLDLQCTPGDLASNMPTVQRLLTRASCASATRHTAMTLNLWGRFPPAQWCAMSLLWRESVLSDTPCCFETLKVPP